MVISENCNHCGFEISITQYFICADCGLDACDFCLSTHCGIKEIGKELVRRVAGESTCQKRAVVCVLLDKNNLIVAAESNRCAPDGVCPRLSRFSTKENYPPDTCNSEHAEVRAMKLAKRPPKTAIIF